MDYNTLIEKWNNISSFKEKKGYKALRINAYCVPDLFIGIDEEDYRHLLLFLPESMDIKIKGTNKSKLILSFSANQGVLSIKLKDSHFNDLFNDLILSIQTKICSISDPSKASAELVGTFYKWLVFFEETKDKQLSEEQLQGLFGELFFLSKILKESSQLNIDRQLNSWKGPYNAVHDFEFETKSIEVKTKKESGSFINISSEYQLEKEIKQLELLVVSIKMDLQNGNSIHEILLSITDQVRLKNGDISIIHKALSQKNLTFSSLRKYNNYRFTVTKTELYNTESTAFPKLTKSNVKDGISGIKYRLDTRALESYLIDTKTY